MIQQLLIKYLIQNGRLGIPDIGIFQVKRIPAQVVYAIILLLLGVAAIAYYYL